MPSLLSYVTVGVVAAGVTAALIPIASRLAWKLGAVVTPDDRGVHAEPVAAAGGSAMLGGTAAAVVTAKLTVSELDATLAETSQLVGVLSAAAAILAVGFVDDIRDISPTAKVAGMAVAGLILAAADVSIAVFRVPFHDLFFLSGGWSTLMTVLWVVGMANTVNLIDGLDGLAAGIVAIASGTFLLYALRLAEAGVIDAVNPGPVWAAIACGACVGFLPHNVHPARVFMGDGGALLLGLLMAASTMSVGGRSTGEFSGQAFFFYAPLFIPLVILGVPVADTAFAIVRRAARRRRVSMPDKEHLHHRLMRLGHGHRRSVLILWLWTALLSAFVLYPTYTGRGDGVVPTGIAALALALFTIFHPRLGNANSAGSEPLSGGSAPRGEEAAADAEERLDGG